MSLSTSTLYCCWLMILPKISVKKFLSFAKIFFRISTLDLSFSRAKLLPKSCSESSENQPLIDTNPWWHCILRNSLTLQYTNVCVNKIPSRDPIDRRMSIVSYELRLHHQWTFQWLLALSASAELSSFRPAGMQRSGRRSHGIFPPSNGFSSRHRLRNRTACSTSACRQRQPPYRLLKPTKKQEAHQLARRS